MLNRYWAIRHKHLSCHRHEHLFSTIGIICARRANLKHFKRGTLIFFYESTRRGGRAALVAMARVRQAYLKHCTDLDFEEFEYSVLNDKTIGAVGTSELKTVVIFDNIFVLHREVPLGALKNFGCGSSTKLLTTNPISDAQTQAILQEAFSNV
ncbi:EVE domain-containing protein [Chromobacterium haemolyticum]|nr:EVE domain-containing protein [Chromobacterium haemolyticum]